MLGYFVADKIARLFLLELFLKKVTGHMRVRYLNKYIFMIKMDVSELIRKTGLRRGLSPKTIKTYRHSVKYFFNNYCRKDPRHVNKKDITDYLDKIIEKGACGNTINVHLNALKFFYNEILGKRLMINIRYSKTPKRLPEVLTKQEVARLIDATKNPKHRLMICMKYSTGIRVLELVKLRVRDLEMDNGYGWVRNGKGGEDRLIIIAEKLKPDIDFFIKENQLNFNEYFFKGQKSGHLTTETFRKIVKRSMKLAKITKNVTPHTLCHSFATHVIEQGDDVVSLQSLLGHSNARTTMTYIHTAVNKAINVKSPFDSLEL